MNIRRVAVTFVLLAASQLLRLNTMFVSFPIENVPIERVTQNLERRAKRTRATSKRSSISAVCMQWRMR